MLILDIHGDTSDVNNDVKTDNFGNQYCYLRTTSGWTAPQASKLIIAYAYADSYNVGALQSSSGNQLTIGFLASDSTTTSPPMCSVSLASFGMKKN